MAENNIKLYYTCCQVVPTINPEMSIQAMRSRLIQIFHGFMANNPGKIAISVDNEAKKTYVFALSEEDLKNFVSSVKDHHFIRDYYIFSFPECYDVSNGSGKWAYFEQYRIPTIRKSITGEVISKWRDKRLHDVQELKMPYFKLRSKSNGAVYTVPVRISEAIGYCGFKPNGYGLSRISDRFALPVFD